jgi:hypothetical protein
MFFAHVAHTFLFSCAKILERRILVGNIGDMLLGHRHFSFTAFYLGHVVESNGATVPFPP